MKGLDNFFWKMHTFATQAKLSFNMSANPAGWRLEVRLFKSYVTTNCLKMFPQTVSYIIPGYNRS